MSDEVAKPNDSISGVHEVLRELRTDVRETKEDVAEIHQVLFKGNGASLLTRVALLEQNQQAVAAQSSNQQNKRWGLQMAGIGFVSAVLGGVVLAIFNMLIGTGG